MIKVHDMTFTRGDCKILANLLKKEKNNIKHTMDITDPEDTPRMMELEMYLNSVEYLQEKFQKEIKQ